MTRCGSICLAPAPVCNRGSIRRCASGCDPLILSFSPLGRGEPGSGSRETRIRLLLTRERDNELRLGLSATRFRSQSGKHEAPCLRLQPPHPVLLPRWGEGNLFRVRVKSASIPSPQPGREAGRGGGVPSPRYGAAATSFGARAAGASQQGRLFVAAKDLAEETFLCRLGR